MLFKALVAAILAYNASAFVHHIASPHFAVTSLKMSSEAAPTTLDPSETALVLIEYQNEFTTEGKQV